MVMKRAVLILCVVLLLSSLIGVPASAAPSIHAQAAIVLDFETGDILFERDAHTMRVPASMTKLVTAFIVYEEIAAGRLTMDTMIPISRNAARVGSDRNLQGNPVPLPSSAYSVDHLLHLLMLPSSNGGCIAFAEHISGSVEAFVVLMNETGKSIGMKTEFTNPHGAIAHYTTAHSMGILTREFISKYPDILRISAAKSMTHEGATLNNTNFLLHDGSQFYQGADGFKTGTIRESGCCLSSTAERDGRRVIVVVMNTQNNDQRYGDSRTLLNFGFAELARKDAEKTRRDAELAKIEAERIKVILDDVHMEFDVDPQMVNDRTMVPMRAIFEAFGAQVEWEDATKTITALTPDEDVIVLRIGSRTIEVNGVSSEIDVAPFIVNSRTLVPAKFVAEAMGATVDWDGATRTVIIKTT